MINDNDLEALKVCAEPVKLLIEKVSNGLGWALEPARIPFMSLAESYAKVKEAKTEDQVSQINQQKWERFALAEEKKENNIAQIVSNAIPGLEEGATPDQIDEDWIALFLERAKLINTDEMQKLWGKVLAGESNQQGSYSKRTIDFLSTMDKSDAESFTTLCSFNWFMADNTVIVWNHVKPIYPKLGITFDLLLHLESIGLISLDLDKGYHIFGLPEKFIISYFGAKFLVELPPNKKSIIDIGQVLFTQTGRELSPICGAEDSEEIQDYCLEQWKKQGYKITAIQ